MSYIKAGVQNISPISPLPPPYEADQRHHVAHLLPCEISTKENSLASGFPYDERLVKLGISPAEWTQFSDQIIRCATLSFAERSSVFAIGVGTTMVTPLSSLVLSPFGKGPAQAATKLARQKSVQKKVEAGLEGGELRAIISFWNEKKFGDRGFHAELLIPSKAKVAQDEVLKRSDSSVANMENSNQKNNNRKRYTIVLRSCSAVDSVAIAPEPVIDELPQTPIYEMSGEPAVAGVCELVGDVPQR